MLGLEDTHTQARETIMREESGKQQRGKQCNRCTKKQIFDDVPTSQISHLLWFAHSCTLPQPCYFLSFCLVPTFPPLPTNYQSTYWLNQLPFCHLYVLGFSHLYQPIRPEIRCLLKEDTDYNVMVNLWRGDEQSLRRWKVPNEEDKQGIYDLDTALGCALYVL